MTEVWRLESNRATLRTGGFSATHDATQPEVGLRLVTQGDAVVADALLGVGLESQPLRLVDCFVRASDLVCRYETEDGHTHLTAYWRVDASAENGALSVDLVASVRTDVLEAFPDLRSASVYPKSQAGVWTPADGLGANGDQAVIVAGERWSAVELPLEGLQSEPSVQSKDASASVSWRLASGFMEKGVIRRAVLRCRIQREPIDSADGQVAEWLEELRAPGPPLSA